MSPTPAGSGSSKSSSVFCGAYVAKGVDAVENKGSGNTTPVDLQALLEAFLNVSLRCACFSDETFLCACVCVFVCVCVCVCVCVPVCGERQNFQLWGYSQGY